MRGDAIRRGEYIQHSVFRRVANYSSEAGLVSLVSKSIGAGPCNIVLRELPAKWPNKIRIDTDEIICDNIPVQLKTVPIYGSGISIDEKWTKWTQLMENLQFVVKKLTDQAHEKSLAFVLKADRVTFFESGMEQALVQRVLGAMELWKAGAYSLAMKKLKGSGFGLTPSGDDFNAGLLTGFHVLEALLPARKTTAYKLVVKGARRVVFGGNPLANSGLYHARAGRVTARQKTFIHELFKENNQQLTLALDDILVTGETSGADWLTGFVFIVEKEIKSWLSSAE